MYHPPRGGVRGGRDQFNWEDVKTDKHRENYLGHSLFAPVGRWQKGKDLTWYSKDGKNDQEYNDEIKAIKDAEADVMAEFLGAGKRKKVTGNVTQQELSNVLKKEQEEDDDDEILKEADKDATKGLGYKSIGRSHIGEMIPNDSETIENGDILKNSEKMPQNDNDYSISTSVVTSDNLTGKLTASKKHKKEKKEKKEKKKRKKHKRDSRSLSPVRKRSRL
ncbi:multiple myeloma tumor-associated protein 2-like [Gigaspora margarita]|uniref:Multiple myeloma tumor-associated protein 2-like n=2 Tax=Gigaspora margarita TaxID=4874 RepID=A0A8H3XDP4_GIGMA|nr:multiple myeloma tumor-associated protein 2-like [Gigaspora margarita]